MQERRRGRKVSTEGGYIPNPYGRDLGLGYRVRTLPLGFLSPTRGTERVVKTIEDRWGIYSTKGGYILSFLRFLSPANGGNEGGVKTIERRDSKKAKAISHF